MTIMDNHHFAMELADKADRAKRLGMLDEAKVYFKEAFDLESQAALSLRDRQTIEPTRSILFRSSAALAIECNELREAERMIAYALAGFPPTEIAEELRDLLERVNFERHLQLRGVTLSPNEFQLSMWGPAVGLGFAQSREFRERIEKVETLSYRTLERKLKKPFREAGRPAKDISDIFDVYISIPRAASFAVTFRLASDQMYLPGLDLGIDVADELVECLDMINQNEDTALKERISDEAYFSNFVSLAKQLAPDGKRVTHVGLTLKRGDKEKKVVIKRKHNELYTLHDTNDTHDNIDNFEIRGTLRFADATKKRHGKIVLVDQHNAIHKILVPLGMMADIVRPMFDYDVIVRGTRDIRGNIFLQDIELQNDE